MLVLCSLCTSVCRFTVSNAFERPRAIAMVLFFFFLLKLLEIMLFILCSAVAVECLRLNPCWCGGMIMLFVMCGRMIYFSSVLAMGESNALGLFDVPSVASLPGLGIGIILAIFHVCGIVLVLSERLKIALRYVSAVFPSCLMFMLSGPVELLF